MAPPLSDRIGYVVKTYPRFSETFVVSEILAHEAAGADLDVFSLRPSVDSHFQDGIARVRAAVHHLPASDVRASTLWTTLERVGRRYPRLWRVLGEGAICSARDVHQAALLAEAVGERGIGHLHAHFATAATTVARLAARIAGISYTFTAHAKDIFHESVQEEDLRRKMADASCVVTVSRFNAAFLAERFGVSADRIRCVYNGLDLGDFAFTPPRDRPARILAVGRLVEKKGFADLVAACAVLAAEGMAFECEIVGAGALEADLRAAIARAGLERRVRLAGPRPRDEVVARLRQAALLAVPCVQARDGDRDGLPTVLLEAMAAGTPCVATRVTGIPEAVRDGQTGLLVPQSDPERLAGAIRRLLLDRAAGEDLARRARQLVETEFDIHRNASRLRTIFRDASPTAQAA